MINSHCRLLRTPILNATGLLALLVIAVGLAPHRAVAKAFDFVPDPDSPPAFGRLYYDSRSDNPNGYLMSEAWEIPIYRSGISPIAGGVQFWDTSTPNPLLYGSGILYSVLSFTFYWDPYDPPNEQYYCLKWATSGEIITEGHGYWQPVQLSSDVPDAATPTILLLALSLMALGILGWRCKVIIEPYTTTISACDAMTLEQLLGYVRFSRRRKARLHRTKNQTSCPLSVSMAARIAAIMLGERRC
jgi:hypothetical protein